MELLDFLDSCGLEAEGQATRELLRAAVHRPPLPGARGLERTPLGARRNTISTWPIWEGGVGRTE